jgi:hypothetical protein
MARLQGPDMGFDGRPVFLPQILMPVHSCKIKKSIILIILINIYYLLQLCVLIKAWRMRDPPASCLPADVAGTSGQSSSCRCWGSSLAPCQLRTYRFGTRKQKRF